MAPQEKDTGFEPNSATATDSNNNKAMPSAKVEQTELSWTHIVYYILLHITGLYGGYLFLFKAKIATCVFAYLVYAATMVGITAGTHRLWSHRSYKAKLPLKWILAIFSVLGIQPAVLVWARDHRCHHKYTDTNADPHNASRGFFYSHIGWIMMRKNSEVLAKGAAIDISDLLADEVVMLQYKYFWPLATVFAVLAPTYLPTLWTESVWNAFFVCVAFRLLLSYHCTFLINSAAHTFGMKPYDKSIRPGEVAAVAFLTLGDGFHNYHHTFPWDYRSSELGFYYLNLSGYFIYLMSKIGWAYDLKTASKELVAMRAKRTGDGSRGISLVWGWDDKDITKLERDHAIIVNPDGSKPYM